MNRQLAFSQRGVVRWCGVLVAFAVVLGFGSRDRAQDKGVPKKEAPAIPGGGAATSGNGVRALRVIEVLEYIGTPDAKQTLEQLAKTAGDARLVREAKASLRRLTGRPAAEGR